MPDHRKHRGRHPEDDTLFDVSQHDKLRSAVSDYSYLLGRGYAHKSTLKLVGDRYALTARQRVAVERSTCSAGDSEARLAKCITLPDCEGITILVDGYNILIVLESALSGGVLLCGNDGVIRDIASIHGSYRTVEETIPALEILGNALNTANPARIEIYLDSPISNSGKLKQKMDELAAANQWDWTVILDKNPDRVLCESNEVVISSDSLILDRCRSWVNLAAEIIPQAIPTAGIIDLG